MKKCALLLTGIMLIGCVAAGCGNRNETDGAGKETTQAAYELEYETGNMNAEFARKSDGTYVCDEYTYQYKLWLSSGNSTYVVLSNNKAVTYEDVEKLMTSSGPEVNDRSKFVPVGYYFTGVKCDIGHDGSYIYRGKSYKSVMMFDEVMADSGKRCFYIVLTNDASITLDKVIKSSEADADTFVVIDEYQE